MSKKITKWYVVKNHSRQYSAHIFDDYKQCKAFAKSVKTFCKGFSSKEEAIAYAGCKESKIYFHITPPTPTKICLVCEKPFKSRTKLCPTCNKLRGSMTVTTAVALKTIYPDADIFKLKELNPYITYSVSRQTTKAERAEMRKNRQATLRSVEYKDSQYKKEDLHIPDYISRIFEKDETKELLYLEGDKLNPFVYYTCKKCGLEQCQKYEKLKVNAGHNCESEKSSGEVIVEEFLKVSNIPYRIQFDTLKCVNPKTRKIMPYDFELTSHRIIIEVQGKQHLEYIPYFHGSEENYQYQLWKDDYKRNFAIKNGYSVLYLTYQDIQTGAYKQMIHSIMTEKQGV